MEHQKRSYTNILMKAAQTAVFGLFLLFNFNALSQVNAKVDTTAIRIGEEIIYQVNVEADSTQLVLFPEGQTFLPLEVIESPDPDTVRENDKFRIIKKYGLTQFDSGRYVIPPQKIVIGDRVFSTDSMSVEVRDVAVDTTQQKMFDIKPATDVGGTPLDWKGILLWLVPLLLVLAVVLYWFRRRKQAAQEEIVLEPLEEALESLRKLDEAPYLKSGKTKAYYTGLTDVLKRYLFREIDDGALERTSDELIAQLELLKDAQKFDFEPSTIIQLEKILARADLVKFARQQVDGPQVAADRSGIETFVITAHEAVPEPTEEELKETEQYRLELKRRRKRRRIILGISTSFASLFLALMIYGSIAGFDNLKDSLFGNELRELSEGRWYRSEYGNPSVVIETPEILSRQSMEGDTLSRPVNIFSFGSELDPLYVSVYTGPLGGGQEEDTQVNLERLLDEALADLEARGARNMLVKRADFETENGLKGLKAFGEFYVQVSEDRVLKNASQYELILFAQPGSIQQILLVYQDDERYAEGIKQRILDSIELELQKTAAKDG